MAFLKKRNTTSEMTQVALAELINSLCVDVNDLYSVDRATQTVTVVRQAGVALGLDKVLCRPNGYEAAINAYISCNVHPEDREALRPQLRFDVLCERLKQDANINFFYRVLRGSGVEYFRLKCVRQGAAESFSSVIFAFMPETASAGDALTLHAIETDEITGVLTKQAFFHHARQLLEKNPDKEYDLVLSDIENFKLVNSVYGIPAGDSILRYLADSCSRFERAILCARYSGDQFVVLTEASTDEQIEQFRQRTKTIRKNAPVPFLTIKYGVYRRVDHGDSIAALCDKAMIALRSVKHTAEDPVAFYEGQVIENYYKAQMFESRFEKAITDREFVVWFQPKYSTSSKTLSSAEALVRWKDKDGTLIKPSEFVPVFETCGLITQLDEYVFRQVCQIQKQLIDDGITPIPVSVNMSPASLFRPGVVERYRSIIDTYGVPQAYIPIELTESATISGMHGGVLIQSLREAGFTLHLDDFGSGYSSLSSLSNLPFSVVKLDKSLVDDVGNTKGDEVIRHIIELVHFLKMEVVTEGVETGDQYNFLNKLQCDTIQGYYFSRPIPQSEFLALVKETRAAGLLTEQEKDALTEAAGIGSLRITNDMKLQYLSALGSIYMTMHVIDLKEDTVVEFATTTNVKEHVNRLHNAPEQMKMAMLHTVAPEYVPAVLEFTDLSTIAARMKGKRTIAAEFVGIHFGWFQARFITVTTNENDEPEKIIFTTQVIEADKRKEELLVRACHTDELTGVYNRLAFEEDMKALADPANHEREDSADLAVMAVDVLGVKAVNDTLGHAAGDELMWGTAGILTDVLGKGSKVYRLEGGTFAAVFYAGDDRIAQLKRAYVEATENWMGNEVRSLRTAFGFATRKEFPELTPEALAEQAKARMLEQKTSNK